MIKNKCSLSRPSFHFRCVLAPLVGAEFLLEEPHRSGLHAGTLLSTGGHGERRLWQSRRRRQPQHRRWRDRHVPAAGRQREEAASHSLPLSPGSKDIPTVSTDSFVCLFKCTCFFVMGMKHLCKRFLLSVSTLACEGQSFSTSIRYPEIGLVIWFRLMATFVSPSDG